MLIKNPIMMMTNKTIPNIIHNIFLRRNKKITKHFAKGNNSYRQETAILISKLQQCLVSSRMVHPNEPLRPAQGKRKVNFCSFLCKKYIVGIHQENKSLWLVWPR